MGNRTGHRNHRRTPSSLYRNSPAFMSHTFSGVRARTSPPSRHPLRGPLGTRPSLPSAVSPTSSYSTGRPTLSFASNSAEPARWSSYRSTALRKSSLPRTAQPCVRKCATWSPRKTTQRLATSFGSRCRGWATSARGDPRRPGYSLCGRLSSAPLSAYRSLFSRPSPPNHTSPIIQAINRTASLSHSRTVSIVSFVINTK